MVKVSQAWHSWMWVYRLFVTTDLCWWHCRLGAEALNNEFFSKSCVEWSERLAQGGYCLYEWQFHFKTQHLFWFHLSVIACLFMPRLCQYWLVFYEMIIFIFVFVELFLSVLWCCWLGYRMGHLVCKNLWQLFQGCFFVQNLEEEKSMTHAVRVNLENGWIS